MRRRMSCCLPMAAGIAMSFATAAEAHVKWFSSYDISEPPQRIARAFDANFDALLALSLVLLLLGCAVESLAPGRALLRGINALTGPMEADAGVLIRGGCGFFLVALWTLGGIILTPELKTGLAWIPWFQLAIAACLLWRNTLALAGLGLIALYAIAVHAYGLFHLLDYPIFIGLALYLIMLGMRDPVFGIRAIDVLRMSVAITLMWASVEKWAYPQWSYPIILSNPKLTMGFSPEYYMQAAGLVEFALSFAIVLGPLVRRTAAAMLLGIFVAAIGPFGKIDAIGHAPIIAVLAVIICDSAPGGGLLPFEMTSVLRFVRSLCVVTSGFGAALISVVAAYYALHTEFYPGNVVALCGCPAHVPSTHESRPLVATAARSPELRACRFLRDAPGSRSRFLQAQPGGAGTGLAEVPGPARLSAVCEARPAEGIDIPRD